MDVVGIKEGLDLKQPEARMLGIPRELREFIGLDNGGSGRVSRGVHWGNHRRWPGGSYLSASPLLHYRKPFIGCGLESIELLLRLLQVGLQSCDLGRQTGIKGLQLLIF